MPALLAAAALALPASTGGAPSSAAKLLGQRIMVGFPGTSAPAALLTRIRAGQVGAVILFGANIASDRQVRPRVSAVQGLPSGPRLLASIESR